MLCLLDGLSPKVGEEGQGVPATLAQSSGWLEPQGAAAQVAHGPVVVVSVPTRLMDKSCLSMCPVTDTYLVLKSSELDTTGLREPRGRDTLTEHLGSPLRSLSARGGEGGEVWSRGGVHPMNKGPQV